MSGDLLMIYICNFHVLSHLLLIYICKLHWNIVKQDDSGCSCLTIGLEAGDLLFMALRGAANHAKVTEVLRDVLYQVKLLLIYI